MFSWNITSNLHIREIAIIINDKFTRQNIINSVNTIPGIFEDYRTKIVLIFIGNIKNISTIQFY